MFFTKLALCFQAEFWKQFFLFGCSSHWNHFMIWLLGPIWYHSFIHTHTKLDWNFEPWVVFLMVKKNNGISGAPHFSIPSIFVPSTFDSLSHIPFHPNLYLFPLYLFLQDTSLLLAWICKPLILHTFIGKTHGRLLNHESIQNVCHLV